MRVHQFRSTSGDIQIAAAHLRQPKALVRASFFFCIGIVPVQMACLPSTAQQVSAGQPTSLAANYGKLPLSFEANRGQVDPQVRFLSRGNGYSLFLTDRAAVLSLRKREASSASKQPAFFKADVVRMELSGASSDLHISGDSRLPGDANYFIGNVPAKWRSAVPTYAHVKYQHVYPGVDLVYYGNQNQLEYDFVVAPGADPKLIRLQFSGAKRLNLNQDGDLEIHAQHGQIAFRKPVVYQMKDGQKETVQGGFTLLANNSVAFQLGKYDPARDLVIDPTLAYSTYLSGDSTPTAIAADQEGNLYVTGTVSGAGLTVSTGAFQATNKAVTGIGFDAFVTKLNPAGTTALYSTYLGGSGTATQGDSPSSIKVDSSGNAYIAGLTASANFPTKNPIQAANKGTANGVPNCFVTKLNPTGTGLVYSTYLGGSGIPGHSGAEDNLFIKLAGGDGCSSIALDAAGDAYVAGETFSDNFPTAGNPLQSSNKGYASSLPTAFVAKIDPAGSAFVYSTYLGGSGGDGASSIAVDASGDAYVAGGTQSTNFPAFGNAFQSSLPSGATGSGFVAKLNPQGSALDYATYLGGKAGGGLITSIAVDKSGNAYLFGETTSVSFPTTSGAFQQSRKPVGIYPWTLTITKLNSTGSGLVYSTYLNSNGGEYIDSPAGMAIDAQGDVYVTGFTLGTDFPVSSNAFQSTNNCAANATAQPALSEPQTGFATELNAAGSALVYSTYLGGTGTVLDTWENGILYESLEECFDQGLGLAVDGAGGLYIAGVGSPDFPITTGASAASIPTGNPFVAKFNLEAAASGATVTLLSSSVNPQIAGGSGTFTAFVESTSGSGIPTGSVTFTLDGTQVGVESLGKTGKAAVTVANLAEGKHTVKATYGGGGSFSGSSSSYEETVFGAATKISIVSGNNQTAVYGAAFANPIVVLVTDASGNPIPGAAVSVTGTGVKSTNGVTGANGQASIIVTATGTGTLAAKAGLVTASSPSTALTLTGTPAVLTITAGNASVFYQHPLPKFVYTATGFVLQDTSAILTGTPTETTTAKDGSPGGTYPIDITQGTLQAKNYTLKYVNGTLTIVQLATVSSIALTVSPSSAALGSTFTATALVTESTGKPATSGTVSFYDGSVLLGSASIVASTGKATFKTRSLTPGANTLHATSVLGLALSPTTSNSVAITATGKEAVSAVLSDSGTEGSYTLSAALTDAGPGVPTGSVTFTDQSTSTKLGTASLSPVNGGLSYNTSATVTVGNNPTQAILADVNRDGIPDLIGTFYGGTTKTNWISVSIGKGDGTFMPQQFVTTNASSNSGGSAVAVADFNGDGIPDLAGASWAGNGLAVFLGKGDGTFGTETDLPIDDHYAVAIATGDFNGDGYTDIVTADYYGATISILLGKGNGTFEPETPYTAQTNPEAVAIGDVNGDGLPDIVVGNGAGTISLFLGNGNGTFQPQKLITINSSLDLGNCGLALGDVNGDGKLDMVVTRYAKDAIDILLGNGDGTFQTPSLVNVAAGAAPTGAAIADVNRDGIPDLVVSSASSGSTTVLLGTGGGAFKPYQVSGSSGANSVSVADVNGDGVLDFATADSAAGTFGVLLGHGAYTAAISGVTLTGTGNDSVVASYGGNTNFAAATSAPLVLRSKGTTVATPSFSPAAGTYTSAQSVTIADKTAGSVIHYTTNGSAPTSASAVYSGAIAVSATETIQAIAIASGLTNSSIGSATYTVNLPQAKTPTFSLVAGTYSSAQSVALADSTAGSTIYYTTNGATPTTSSTKYTKPIAVSATETIKAIAIASGYSNSAVASATYTIE